MTQKSIGFGTEAELASCFSNLMQETRNRLNLEVGMQYEVPAPGVIPDLVIYSEERHILQYVITVEFKLSNWRRALHQAFRHRNFGNEAYVILDYARSQTARRNLDVFKKANVGLITVGAEGGIRTWYLPEPSLPFSKEFSQMVAGSLLSPRQPMPTDLPFINSIRGGDTLSRHIFGTSVYS